MNEFITAPTASLQKEKILREHVMFTELYFCGLGNITR